MAAELSAEEEQVGPAGLVFPGSGWAGPRGFLPHHRSFPIVILATAGCEAGFFFPILPMGNLHPTQPPIRAASKPAASQPTQRPPYSTPIHATPPNLPVPREPWQGPGRCWGVCPRCPEQRVPAGRPPCRGDDAWGWMRVHALPTPQASRDVPASSAGLASPREDVAGLGERGPGAGRGASGGRSDPCLSPFFVRLPTRGRWASLWMGMWSLGAGLGELPGSLCPLGLSHWPRWWRWGLQSEGKSSRFPSKMVGFPVGWLVGFLL